MYANYIRGKIHDSKELLNLQWKLQVLHAWMSTSKHSHSFRNAADVADNLTTKIYTLQCIFYLKFRLQSHLDKSPICISINSKIRIVVIHSLVVFIIYQRRVKNV